jgi:hypothetical protein
MTMTITKFCDLHDACRDGREWAIATGCTTMAELWQRDDIRPEWRQWIATRRGVMSNRDLRLFACWCVRQVWHLLTDERSRYAVEVAERCAVGEATEDELAAARAAAYDAAYAAAYAAARAAARAAADAAYAAYAADAAYAAAADASAYAAQSAQSAQSAQLKTYAVTFKKEDAQ